MRYKKNNSQTGFKRKRDNMRMLNYVKEKFSEYVNFILWVELIVCTIAGAVVGYYSAEHEIIGIIIGLVLGFLIGMFFNIILGGFVATLISIEKNTKINNEFNEEEIEENEFDESELKENEIIIYKQITLYETPNINSKIVCDLLRGEIVTIIEKKNINSVLWHNLKDNAGNIGWSKI